MAAARCSVSYHPTPTEKECFMTASYALVLTGEVLPGSTPESAWPKLAAYLRMEPEKLTQLLARAPLTIKQDEDPAPLQALQAGIAATGAETELCQPDERPALLVLVNGVPRGPLPRTLAEQRVRQGLWPDSISATPADSSQWKPYWELDAAAAAPLPAPPPSTPYKPMPSVTEARPGPSGLALPPGAAIHAGFWRRTAAFLIDGWVLFIPSVFILIPFLGPILFNIGRWLYFTLMESSNWQATLGKRAMGIKVTDQFGRRIEFGRATGRYFGGILSYIIMYIGYMMVGWTKRKQGLHDMIAGTCVVFNEVDPDQPMPTQRPPMPWYGWAVNVLSFGIVVSILAAIAAYAYQDYGQRAKVAQVIASAIPLKEEVDSQGCRPGNRPSPHAMIETAEVKSAEAEEACTIMLTFSQSPRLARPLRGKTINFTTDEDDKWICTSTAPDKYLPASCRSH
jgi:uncharacterized RDD family membrane protein YckC